MGNRVDWVTVYDIGRESGAKLYALNVLVHEAVAENCAQAFKGPSVLIEVHPNDPRGVDVRAHYDN
uniref:Uncharacterized protein n=1 Tax=Oryza brachyantha TaxID=4533 RepID=J3LBS4_ORYBR